MGEPIRSGGPVTPDSTPLINRYIEIYQPQREAINRVIEEWKESGKTSKDAYQAYKKLSQIKNVIDQSIKQEKKPENVDENKYARYRSLVESTSLLANRMLKLVESKKPVEQPHTQYASAAAARAAFEGIAKSLDRDSATIRQRQEWNPPTLKKAASTSGNIKATRNGPPPTLPKKRDSQRANPVKPAPTAKPDTTNAQIPGEMKRKSDTERNSGREPSTKTE